MPADLVVLIVAQTFLAATFHWAPRGGGGRFLFSVAVDESFPRSDEGRAILAAYRWRVWAHWIVSCAIVTALCQWGPARRAHRSSLAALRGGDRLRVRHRRVRPTARRRRHPDGRPLSSSGPPRRLARPVRSVPDPRRRRLRGLARAARYRCPSGAGRTPTFRPPPFGAAVGFVVGAAVFCGLLLALALSLRARARHPSAAARRQHAPDRARGRVPGGGDVRGHLPARVRRARDAGAMQIVRVPLLGLVVVFVIVLVHLSRRRGDRPPRDSTRRATTDGSGVSSTATPTTRRCSCRSGRRRLHPQLRPARRLDPRRRLRREPAGTFLLPALLAR